MWRIVFLVAVVWLVAACIAAFVFGRCVREMGK